MVVLRESPWYQQILKQGENQGIVSAIEVSLEIKFGNEGLQLMPEISQITDLEKLKNIQRGIITMNNLDELREFMRSI